jgi:LacI family transcriptional regulator
MEIRKMRVNEKPATIYDIAKLAGVNPSTVSRALSTPGRINAVTEAKIKAAAAELNYKANPFARALPTGKTKMIALMIADITNPVFFKVVRGAEQEAAERGYTLVVAESQESNIIEAKSLERILPAVDGVILGTTRLTDKEIQQVNYEKPVVLVNRAVDDVCDVAPDNEPGIKEAIDHLASLGHHSIAFLNGPANSWIGNQRWNFIMKHAVAAGMTVVEIGPNAPTLQTGEQVLDRVRAAGVTAVFTYNDLMGIGLLRAARAAGIDVPGDLSVIGFDNIFGSDFTSPALTTVQLDLQSLGRKAAGILIDSFETGEDLKPATGEGQTSLLVRGSTGVAKA